MMKPKAKTILIRLNERETYLNTFKDENDNNIRATIFEKLIAEAFSCILNLPLYSLDDDKPEMPYRVTWYGRVSTMKPEPEGPDTIVYGYDFFLLIEATRLKGRKQWSREFSPAISHCKEFCEQPEVRHEDVFVLLVCDHPLCEETFQSIKVNPDRDKYKLIPMETETVIKILETSLVALTMTHLEIRKLFPKIHNALKQTSSLQEFKGRVNTKIDEWQKEVLKDEKEAFTGIKSYEILLSAAKGGSEDLKLSQIFNALLRQPTVQQYFDVIGKNVLNPELVEQSLVPQGLASCVGRTINDEPRYVATPLADFRNRNDRLVKELRKIK